MTFYKISAFSRLGQVSIKALRLYDQRGLLTPARVDVDTSYRYYTVDQLPRLHRILALKAMGLSLEQIGQLLNDSLSPEQMQAMLKVKQAELKHQLVEGQRRLATITAHLKHVQEEHTMPDYDVILKSVEPLNHVLSIRETIPAYTAVGELFTELMAYLTQQRAQPQGPAASIWHDPEYKEQDVDAEAIIIVSDAVTGTDRIQTKALPALEQVAAVIHRGPYSTLNQAYGAITNWIEESGYQITGPNREIYLQGGVERDNASYVTEIQFPVAKVTA